MMLPRIISSVVVRARARQAREPGAGLSLGLLFLTLAWGLAPGFAAADPIQSQGTIVITDLAERPVEAVVSGGTNGVNSTIRATQDKPETLDFAGVRTVVDGKVVVDKDTGQEIVSGFSFDVDGVIVEGTGIAVFLERDGTLSDLLMVTLRSRGKRFNVNTMKVDLDFFGVTLVFNSDSDPGGLDLAGLGLTDEVMQKLLSTKADGGALQEDGTEQDLGARLIDMTTGNRFGIGGVVIKAASDMPEPSSLLLVALALVFAIGRRWPQVRAV